MKIIYLFILLIPTLSLALDKCFDYPIHNSKVEEYRGKITAESATLSFNDCPDSVMVNNRNIARLSQVLMYQGRNQCIYSFNRVAFMCENNYSL